jgi:hypothetical protein
MLLLSRIIELESPQSSSCHEQECDILNVIDILLVRVLQRNASVNAQKAQRSTHIEDLEDIEIADHCRSEVTPVLAQSPRWEFDSQYRATASARHSSIDEDTSPRTEPGV